MRNWLLSLALATLILAPACSDVVSTPLSVLVLAEVFESDGPTPAGTCNDIDVAICERFDECLDASFEDCIESRQQNRLMNPGFACEEFTESRSNCASGQVYNAETASACIDDIQAISCEGFQLDMSPGECQNVCEDAP